MPAKKRKVPPAQQGLARAYLSNVYAEFPSALTAVKNGHMLHLYTCKARRADVMKELRRRFPSVTFSVQVDTDLWSLVKRTLGKNLCHHFSCLNFHLCIKSFFLFLTSLFFNKVTVFSIVTIFFSSHFL